MIVYLFSKCYDSNEFDGWFIETGHVYISRENAFILVNADPRIQTLSDNWRRFAAIQRTKHGLIVAPKNALNNGKAKLIEAAKGLRPVVDILLSGRSGHNVWVTQSIEDYMDLKRNGERVEYASRIFGYQPLVTA